MGYGNTEEYLTAQQREDLIQAYLGRLVTVEIDRPIGHVHHTKGVTLHYTVNYGYLPGVIGGDGEEQDAYILGVDEPLERFTGRIIGAVRRADDNEDKLIAAPEGVYLHQCQIAEAVHFVEKYFDSTVESLSRRLCGVIPYRLREGKAEFLIPCEAGHFPQRLMAPGEEERDTALRALREETGCTTALCPDFRGRVQYDISEKAWETVILFLGQMDGETAGDWVTWEEARDILGREYLPVLVKLRHYLEEKGENHA